MPKRKSDKEGIKFPGVSRSLLEYAEIYQVKKIEEEDEEEATVPAENGDDDDADADAEGGRGGKSGSRSKKVKSDKDSSDGKIELGKMKFVDVREFKGVILVDIREYYEDKNSGELKPGKKGISLQAAQWEVLKENMDKIDAKIEDLEK